MKRSWAVALVGVAYVACRGSEGSRDAQPDAPSDAAVERADVMDAPADAFEWPHETFVTEGELLVHSTEPCADWVPLPEALETPPTASDTFTVKWRVSVEDDVAAGLGAIFVLPTLSPTGDLWFVSVDQHAPARRSLVVVRDGRIVRSPAAPAGSFVVAAPDGRVFTSRNGALLQLRAVETEDGTEVERASVGLGEPDAYTPSTRQANGIVLGPGGMVYAAGIDEQSVFGICGTETPPRLLWERRFLVHPNITYASWVGHGMFVNARGLHVQTQADTFRLDETRYGVELLRFVLGRDGSVVEPPEPHRSHQVVGVLGEGLLERETSPGADGDVASRIRWSGESVWTAPRGAFSAHARVLPNGEVWSHLDGLIVERRDASGALLEDDAFFSGWGGLVDSESRFFVINGEPVVRMTGDRVVDGSATEVLAGRTYPPTFLPVALTGSAMLLGPDGTVYVATGNEVVALQSNSLPPGLDTCVNPSCNWRRDGWVR